MKDKAATVSRFLNTETDETAADIAARAGLNPRSVAQIMVALEKREAVARMGKAGRRFLWRALQLRLPI